ncbi:MAG: hypothetical protein ABWZ40_04085 [Caulobacterales bacterium]
MKVNLAIIGLAALLAACATAKTEAPTAAAAETPAVAATSPADLPATGAVISDWAPASEKDADLLPARRVARKTINRVYQTSPKIPKLDSEIAAAQPGYYRFIMEMEGAAPRTVYKSVVNKSDKGIFVVTKFEKFVP